MDDKLLDFVRRLDSQIMPRIRASTIALLAKDSLGKMHQWGSGVLLRIAEHRFVLTAAHVMDGANDYDLLISTLSGFGESKPSAPLVGFSSRIPEGKTRDHDYLDYCVFELPPDDSHQLAAKSFITMSEVDFRDDQHPQSRYLAFGFPRDLFDGTNATQSALPFLSRIYDVSKQMPEEHVPRREIVLDYSSNNVRSLDDRPAELPNARGMSGCGIWRILHGTVEMDSWQAEQVKLVGIQFSYAREKFLRGTRIGYSLEAIYRRYPNLRPGMRLAYPSATCH